MVGPDWDENPPGLGSADDVKEALAADGLDPMDVDTPGAAAGSHSLTHALAEAPGHGGRTPTQLEAEHDMAVESMKEFGLEHDTELDLGDIR